MFKAMPRTRKIAFTAVFTALAVVANMFTVPISGSNVLSFTYLVCFLAGIYLGVVPGLTVGFLGDLLGHLIMPKADFYNPFIAISSALLGVIPALVWLIPKLKKPDKLLIATAVCAVVCTAGINTYGLWWWLSWSMEGFSKTFWVYLAARAPFQLVMVVANYILTYVILETKVLDKLLMKDTGGAGSDAPRVVKGQKTVE